MSKIKIKAPLPVVTGGGVDFDKWLGIMSDIKGVDFKQDVDGIKRWIIEINKGGSDTKPKLHISEYENLVIKTGEYTEIDVVKSKSKLIQLNSTIRVTVDKFEKDAKLIEEVNRALTTELAKLNGEDSKAKALTKVLAQLTSLSKFHNNLMSVPLMTHIALSKAANSLRVA